MNEIYCSFYLGEFHPLVARTFVCLRKITLSCHVSSIKIEKQTKSFPKENVYSDRSFYRPKKQKCIIFATRRLGSDLKSILKRIYRSMVFKHFARTV